MILQDFSTPPVRLERTHTMNVHVKLKFSQNSERRSVSHKHINLQHQNTNFMANSLQRFQTRWRCTELKI